MQDIRMQLLGLKPKEDEQKAIKVEERKSRSIENTNLESSYESSVQINSQKNQIESERLKPSAMPMLPRSQSQSTVLNEKSQTCTNNFPKKVKYGRLYKRLAPYIKGD